MTMRLVRTIEIERRFDVSGKVLPRKGRRGVRVSIKLVVSGSSKESRIALVGQTGKELLASTTFTEPRAKGATLRALKKILGADVLIEDSTKTNKPPARAIAVIDTVTERTAAVSRPAGRQEEGGRLGPPSPPGDRPCGEGRRRREDDQPGSPPRGPQRPFNPPRRS